MTAALTPTAPATAARSAIPFGRLVRVELRKMVDTRTGFWLITAMLGLSAVIAMAMIAFAKAADVNHGTLFMVMNLPSGVLLPVLAILLVTSEWNQRTGLVTFTLEPRRSRVIGAKFVTALIAAAGAVGSALVFGTVANAVAVLLRDAPAGEWNMTLAGLTNGVLLQVLGLVMAFAFATLLRNSAGAIVAYFALPNAWTALTTAVPWLKENVQQWLDLSTAQTALQDGDWATASQWLHLGTSTALWVVLPLVLGVYRLLRAEIK